MNVNNIDIRELIQRKRLKYFEVAQAAGINQHTLSHWLQTELSDERRERLLKAIDSFK